MSDKIVFRISVRKDVDVVRGSSGKSVCNILDNPRQRREGGRKGGSRLRYGRYDIFSPKNDQILDKGPADIWGQDLVIFRE